MKVGRSTLTTVAGLLDNPMRSLLFLALAAAFLLLGIPYLAFLLALGPSNMPPGETWAMMSVIYLLFLAIVSSGKWALESVRRTDSERPIETIDNKWKYILGSSARISVLILATLGLGFFLNAKDGNAAQWQLFSAFAILAVLSFIAPLVIFWRLWHKNRGVVSPNAQSKDAASRKT
jgi:hypothetical protein